MRYAYALALGLILLGCGEDNAATEVEAPAENMDGGVASQGETLQQEEASDTLAAPDSVLQEEPDAAEAAMDSETSASPDMPDSGVADSENPPVGTPTAIFESDRTNYWLDRPFPGEDIQRADGTLDWEILPEAPGFLGNLLVEGWGAQAALTSSGTAHIPAVYFAFTEAFEVTAGDVGITGPNGTEVPVEWKWVSNVEGDPFFAPHTLIVIPEHTAPLASDTRYVAWVKSETAIGAADWEPTEGTPEGAIVSTAFTTQRSAQELRSLGKAAFEGVQGNPDFLTPTYFKRVESMTYSQGFTESGNPSTLSIITYEDQTTATTYLAPVEGAPDLTVDLGASWPFDVWEAEIDTLAFQTPFENRPWASPGAGLVGDFLLRNEGWIPFVEGEVVVSPVVEPMRIVIQVPKERGEEALPVMLWDHGTGGHAYNAIARASFGDLFEEVANAMSTAVIVSRDQPLYGQRFPLIDEGFGASLGFYNIGNLPTFRDNQRQAAVDHIITQHFVTEGLPDLLAGVATIDLERVGAFGHSLGSVTLHGAMIAQQESTNAVKNAFMSGAGGYLTYYILATGLLTTGSTLVENLAPILGFDPEEVQNFEPYELFGAILGTPEADWALLDRAHPTMQLFATIMDPSDPLSFARDQVIPETILLGVDDYQVPNITTEWLAETTINATLLTCEKQGDYDGHYCTFREQDGFEALEAFISEL